MINPLIIAVYICGIYIFTQGYLLTRLVLPNVSTGCSTAPPARYNKTLLVLIDALRYDFISWDPNIKAADTPHFMNKVPVIRDMLEKKPFNSLLFKGLADAPTTTLQRLIALMTGALPTLVDAGSNFAGSALMEDNLISHLVKAGKSFVTIGDDTWNSLFPSSLNETWPYPSFV
jgi:GPI ethanolamine phosphate transferase 3 subunit O